MNDAFRISRRSRREYDLNGIFVGQVRTGLRLCPWTDLACQFLKRDFCRPRAQFTCMFGTRHNKLGLDLRLHAAREFCRSGVVERHRNDTLKNAAEKSGDPFRAVWPPNQNAVTFLDAL